MLCNPPQAALSPQPGLSVPPGLHQGKHNLCICSSNPTYLHVIWDISSIYCCSRCTNSTLEFIS